MTLPPNPGRKACCLSALAGLLVLLHPPGVQAQDVPDLDGVWTFGSCNPDGSGFSIGCMVLEEDDARLTNRAKAYRDVIDEAAQPKYDCAPIVWGRCRPSCGCSPRRTFPTSWRPSTRSHRDSW